MAEQSVRTCRVCKGLFQYMGNPICQSCQDKLDSDFVKVREYLYDNPSAGVLEVVEETGIEERIVMGFLREGRLELDNGARILSCERCKTPISSGRFCEKCKTVFGKQFGLLNEQMRGAVDEKPEKEALRNQPKMHIDKKIR